MARVDNSLTLGSSYVTRLIFLARIAGQTAYLPPDESLAVGLPPTSLPQRNLSYGIVWCLPTTRLA
jgi:hypothetical protein